MNKHTKEPWFIENKTTIVVYGGKIATPIICECDSSLIIPDEEIEANASRIVACVNACIGLSNELLQSEGYAIKAELDSLDQQIELRMKAEKHIEELNAYIKKLELHLEVSEWNEELLTKKLIEAGIEVENETN